MVALGGGSGESAEVTGTRLDGGGKQGPCFVVLALAPQDGAQRIQVLGEVGVVRRQSPTGNCQRLFRSGRNADNLEASLAETMFQFHCDEKIVFDDEQAGLQTVNSVGDIRPNPGLAAARFGGPDQRSDFRFICGRSESGRCSARPKPARL